MAAVVAVLVAAGVAIAVRGRSDSSTGTALVEVSGQVYRFSPRTCVIVDDSFVVSGRGSSDGERFVASITKAGGLELAFGVDSDIERPLAGQPWWLSGAISDYRIDGRSVQAAVQVEDQTGEVAGKHAASVHATCPPGS